MTHAKTKIATGALLLALTALICSIPMATHADTPSTPVDTIAGTEMVTVQTPLDETMAEYVEALTMLTEVEKQQLLEEAAAAVPYYTRLNELNDQIDLVCNTILHGADDLFAEREKLYDAHKSLWDKLWSSLNDEQKKTDDYIAIIKSSDVLTNSEKEILVKAQERINVLNDGIDGWYEKAEESARNLTDERQTLLNELQELRTKYVLIWAKVYGE